MSFIEDEIKRVQARIAELQPALDEVEQLQKLLESLMEAARHPQPQGTDETPSKRKNFKESERIEQIRKYLEIHAGASNAQIARAIGVTPGRVSQLMPQVKEPQKP